MDELRGHNRLKVAGILGLFALFLGVMILMPGLSKAPAEPSVNLPALSR